MGDDVYSSVTINRGISLRKIQGVSELLMGQLMPETLDNFVSGAQKQTHSYSLTLLPPLSLPQYEDVVQGRLSR